MSAGWRGQAGRLAVLAVGLFVAIALSHTFAKESHAGIPPGIPIDGAFAVDCDASASGIQDDCTYNLGDTFDVQIHITDALETRYTMFQAKLRWSEDTITYLPTGVDIEGIWPHCGFPARAINPDNSVLWGCVPGIGDPVLSDGTDFEGAVIQAQFACPGASPPPSLSPPGGATPIPAASGDVSTIFELVPWVDPVEGDDPQQGTYMANLFLQQVNPETLTDATVLCTAGGPPTGPPPTQEPGAAGVPVPTSLPGTGADSLGGGNGSGARVWLITALLLVAGMAGLAIYGWRHAQAGEKRRG